MVTIGYAGKPVSQATISKLKSAMGDPSKTIYGITLRQGGSGRAPDGGAIVDYPKGWRFLPSATKEQHEILKKNPKVAEALHNLHNLSFVPSTKQYGRDPQAPFVHKTKTEKNQKVVTDAHYRLVIAPQIKAQAEEKARAEEEQRQTIATLKMRVQELTKRPIAEPTAPAVISSLPIIPIIIIAVIVGFFLLRRRA